jgi:hypothetical protein
VEYRGHGSADQAADERQAALPLVARDGADTEAP